MWWMKGLKFPDGYTAGLRRSVNMAIGKLIGLKNHDYHIIMERLMHVMFQGYFVDVVWMVLAELRYFYSVGINSRSRLSRTPGMKVGMRRCERRER
jgi:hypothetical protein